MRRMAVSDIDPDSLAVFVEVLAGGVRAGFTTAEIWTQAAHATANIGLIGEVDLIVSVPAHGGTFSEALGPWLAAGDQRRSIAVVWNMCATTGSDLARALDAVAESLRADIRHRHDRAALCAQAVASARVMVALPAISVAIMVMFDAPTRAFLLSGAGIVAVSVAAALDAIAALWMRRLIEAVR